MSNQLGSRVMEQAIFQAIRKRENARLLELVTPATLSIADQVRGDLRYPLVLNRCKWSAFASAGWCDPVAVCGH